MISHISEVQLEHPDFVPPFHKLAHVPVEYYCVLTSVQTLGGLVRCWAQLAEVVAFESRHEALIVEAVLQVVG